MSETQTEDEIISAYLEAYKRANGRDAPFEIICAHEAFWFEGASDPVGRVSRQELAEMTKSLSRKANEKPAS